MVIAALMLTAALVDEPQVADVSRGEREVLMELFAATGGERWKDHSGWGTARPVCEWRGVFCDYVGVDASRQTVSWLSLDFNNLHGNLPDSLGSLPALKRLSVAGNQLTGVVPESILRRWDAHAFELNLAGTRFSNLVATATVSVASTGVLCSPTADMHFTASYDAASMKATFESRRCAKPTGRETVCVVREGTVFAMDRFSRALALVKFEGLGADYDYPFTASTHQQYVTTTVTWGDERRTTVKTYGRQGPIEAWAAQQLFLGLAADTSWDREFRRPRCSFER